MIKLIIPSTMKRYAPTSRPTTPTEGSINAPTIRAIRPKIILQ